MLKSITGRYLLNKNLIYLFSFLTSLSAYKLSAQEEFGYVNSNYAGVNSLFINPSFDVDSKIFVDAHLVGAEAFFHNNVGFYPRADYVPLARKIPDMVINQTEQNKKGFAKLDLIGPSVAVSWDKFSFGLFTRFRTFADAKMTKSLFALSLKNFNYPDYNGQHFVENAYASTITWFETGFSFGYMYKWTDDETIDLGINVKRLIGYNATDVALSKFDFIYNKKQDISINEVQGEYRMTQPAWGVGKGWGMDIGFNYQKKLGSISGYRPNTKADGCRHIDYKYKIGFSVLDVGAFKVTQNAILQEFDYKNQPFKFDSSQIKSFKDADNYIHTNLVNNGVQQVRGSSYRAWLPFALSAQFDYNFENNWFLNLTAVNSFKISDQTKRIDVFAVTPRYERKYFEVDFPVSLVDFRYPQMGIAFRFGNNFIIGTNRISSVTGKIRDTYGGSIYFNLKIAFYRKCGSKSSKKRYKQGKRPSCPAYAWVDTVGNKKGWGRI